MIESRVFDHTAVVAPFQGSTPAFRVWQAAEDDKRTLSLHALAVDEPHVPAQPTPVIRFGR